MSLLDLMMQQEAAKFLQEYSTPSSSVGLLGQPKSKIQQGLLGALKGIQPYMGYSTTPISFGQAALGAITGGVEGMQDYEKDLKKQSLEKLSVLGSIKDLLAEKPTDWTTVGLASDPSKATFVKKGEEGLTDEAGNPLYAPYVPVVYKQNFRIKETPDGGFTMEMLYEDPSATPTTSEAEEIQKPVVVDLQTRLTQSNEQYDKLYKLYQSFDPSFLQYQGKINSLVTSIKDKAGIDLTEAEKNFLTAFSTFEQEAAEGLNKYIKDITGAQMSEAEAQRLKQGYPNVSDSPTQFQSKLENLMLNNTLSLARTNFFIKNPQQFVDNGVDINNPYAVDENGKKIEGLTSLSDIVKLDVYNPTVSTVGSIQDIILSTATKIMNDLKKANPDADQQLLYNKAIEDTSAYFGVDLTGFLEPK